MRASSNPVFRGIEKENVGYIDSTVKVATFKGVTLKSLLLIAIALAAGFSAPAVMTAVPGLMWPTLAIAGFGSIFLVLIGMRSTRLAPAMGIIYSLFQGLFLGTLTYVVDYYLNMYYGFQGAGLSALIGVGTVFGVMFVLYYFGIIKVTQRLQAVVMGSLIAVIICSLFIMIFGLQQALFSNVGLSIGISAIMIILGAFILTMDFDRANQIVKAGAPAKYEWQVALGLMVTLVWLYVEMLRLVMLLASRRN